MLTRPAGLPVWAGPAVGALVASPFLGLEAARSALATLQNPLLFLVFAVSLAVSLDNLGVFEAIAERFPSGHHLLASLWTLAAAVVIVFNLDAAVVLLTPLYIRIARRHGYPAEALAFQPALLACLASGLLPVSNLLSLAFPAVCVTLDLGKTPA